VDQLVAGWISWSQGGSTGRTVDQLVAGWISWSQGGSAGRRVDQLVEGWISWSQDICRVDQLVAGRL